MPGAAGRAPFIAGAGGTWPVAIGIIAMAAAISQLLPLAPASRAIAATGIAATMLAALRSRALVDRLAAEQERWFLWLPVLFGFGTAVYFWLPVEPPLLAVLGPMLAALAIGRVWREGVLAPMVTGALIALTFGAGLAKLRTELVRAPVLERQITGVEVRGFVEVVEPRPGRGQRITLRVTRIGDFAPEAMPRRVRVRTTIAPADLKPGDALRLRATLSPPAIPALPGDHDFARAAWFAGIGGVGFALTRPLIDLEAGPPPWTLGMWAPVERLRQAIGRRITAVLPGELGAIATALITGERGGISEATNAAYRDSGLFHILSISGLHMVIMAGAVFASARLLLALSPAIALRYPIKKWAAAAATVAALGYLLISGAAFATVRSWIMISLMFLAVMLDRPAIALRNVALAALAILAVFPDSILDVGFQMSFAAVVALVAAYEALRRREDAREQGLLQRPVMRVLLFFGGIVLSTLVAGLAVAPLAAYHFHKSQQFSVLANLIAIPICNLVVMPAALATLVAMPFGLEAWPLALMARGIEGMSWIARLVAALPGAVAQVPATPKAAFGLMVLGGLWLCLWASRWRLLGLALIALGLAVAPLLEHPDVLIGRDGQLVAARQPDRTLAATGTRGAQFELQRWLEHDGDGRRPQALAAGEAYKCDALGCTTTVKGQLLAVARHPAALADDCARARILVVTFARPRGCDRPGVVVDFFDLRRNGTHALYIDADKVRVTSVGEARGDRPWAPRRFDARLPVGARGLAFGSRLGAFAAPFDLADQGGSSPRPEVEDDDPPVIDDDRQP